MRIINFHFVVDDDVVFFSCARLTLTGKHTANNGNFAT